MLAQHDASWEYHQAISGDEKKILHLERVLNDLWLLAKPIKVATQLIITSDCHYLSACWLQLSSESFSIK